MRWVTCALSPGSPPTAALLEDETLFLLQEGTTLVSLLGDDGEKLATAADHARKDPHKTAAPGAVTLLPPIPRPGTVRDFYAFEQHVKVARQRRGLEMEPLWYKLPVFYFSNPYALIGDGAGITPPRQSRELDFELEAAAIMGMGGRDIPASQARRHIAGFCIMNDWSARDLQRDEMKLSMGPVKGKDFATSLGPCMVTPDELEDCREGTAFHLSMKASVNGIPYSTGLLSDLHWSFEEMIAYASRDASCEPGDVIGSGTCGTGCILELALVHGSEQYPWLKSRDTVRLEIDRLGSLSNQVA